MNEWRPAASNVNWLDIKPIFENKDRLYIEMLHEFQEQ